MSDEPINVDVSWSVDAVKTAGRLAASAEGGLETYLRETNELTGRVLSDLPGDVDRATIELLAQRICNLFLGMTFLGYAALLRAPGDLLDLISEIEDQAAEYFGSVPPDLTGHSN